MLCRVCAEDLEDLSAVGSSASPPTIKRELMFTTSVLYVVYKDRPCKRTGKVNSSPSSLLLHDTRAKMLS